LDVLTCPCRAQATPVKSAVTLALPRRCGKGSCSRSARTSWGRPTPTSRGLGSSAWRSSVSAAVTCSAASSAPAASVALGEAIHDTPCGAKWIRSGSPLQNAVATPFESNSAFDVELFARLVGKQGGPAIARAKGSSRCGATPRVEGAVGWNGQEISLDPRASRSARVVGRARVCL
jgi:hypothetical protein